MTNKSDEQEDAEAEVERFRKDLGPFVVAAETTRMPMVFTDAKEPGHPIIFANDSFLSLTGYDREEVLGDRLSFLMARGADPKGLAQVEAAFAGGTDHGSEIRYRRKDGSMFWAAIFISPVRDEGGEVGQHFASFVDLTKQKQEQAQSTMMINELNHRVKNTLATVQSIVWQALRSGSDPKVIREIHRVSLAKFRVPVNSFIKKVALCSEMAPFGVGPVSPIFSTCCKKSCPVLMGARRKFSRSSSRGMPSGSLAAQVRAGPEMAVPKPTIAPNDVRIRSSAASIRGTCNRSNTRKAGCSRSLRTIAKTNGSTISLAT